MRHHQSCKTHSEPCKYLTPTPDVMYRPFFDATIITQSLQQVLKACYQPDIAGYSASGKVHLQEIHRERFTHAMPKNRPVNCRTRHVLDTNKSRNLQPNTITSVKALLGDTFSSNVLVKYNILFHEILH